MSAGEHGNSYRLHVIYEIMNLLFDMERRKVQLQRAAVLIHCLMVWNSLIVLFSFGC